MKDFYSILTNKGLSNLIEAKANGQNIKLTHMAIGDSGENYQEPSPEQKSLYNECHRAEINRIYQDPDYPNQIIIEAAIPSEIGGFFIREVGIFDELGNLFATGKYPSTYKPTSESGAGKDLYIRMILTFSNAPDVEIYANNHNAVVSADQLELYAKIDLSNVPAEKKSHQQWGDLQGGNDTERYHLTENENEAVNRLNAVRGALNKGKCIVLSEDGASFEVCDLPSSLPPFAIFQCLSSKVPAGAYPLWTGEWIRGCRELHPDFWAEVLAHKQAGQIRIISNETYESEISGILKETGGFVLDEENGSLRLPKITRFVQSIENLNQIGLAVSDQFQGHFHSSEIRTDVYGSGDGPAMMTSTGTDEGMHRDGPNMRVLQPITDGTNGIPRYGDETKPKAVRVAQFIQVYTYAHPKSMTDTNAYLGVMREKADVSLSNVDGAFRVIEEVRGINGYVKYSDGRCEQWGRAPHAGTSWITTPFHFSFANDEVHVQLTCMTPASLNSGTPSFQLRYDVNASRFIWHIPSGNGWNCTWRAWGVWK